MRKTVTVLLILALVMSFFVACDPNSGSGGGGGFFPDEKKIPGGSEKTTVWEMSGESMSNTMLAIEVAYFSTGTLEEAINSAFEQRGIDLICDGKQTIEIDDTTKEADYVFAFKSKNSGDIVFKSSGHVSFPKKYETLISYKVSYKTAKDKLIIEGSLQLSDEYDLSYTTVNLNGVNYEPSCFYRADPSEVQKDIAVAHTETTKDFIVVAYNAYLNKGQKTTETAINDKLAELYDEHEIAQKLKCREGGENSITIGNNGYVTIKLDLITVESWYVGNSLSLKASAGGYITSDTNLSLSFNIDLDLESANLETGKQKFEAIGEITVDSAYSLSITFNQMRLDGVEYLPFIYPDD